MNLIHQLFGIPAYKRIPLGISSLLYIFKKCLHQNPKRGKWFGGKAPYGYTYRVIEENNGGQKTRIEEFKGEKDQQEVVTEIYRLFEVLNSLNKFMRELRWNNDFLKSHCIYFIN